MEPREKLFDRFTPVTESGCWLWMASFDGAGYPQVRIKGRPSYGAHRLSYEIHKGPIPPGMCICHKCDIPACVNPDHLFAGTRKDNMQDMIRKNRGRQNGEGNKKVSDAQVLEIRASLLPAKALAKLYGISAGTACNIRAGFSRRNV